MKNKKTIIIIVAVLLIIAVGWRWISLWQPSKPKYPPVPVTTTIAKTSPLYQSIEALGTAKANESVTLTAKVTDHVEKINFTDGDFVKQGKVLVELTKDEQLAQLHNAEATLNEAEKQFKRIETLSKRKISTEAEMDTQRLKVAVAKARIAEIQAKLQDHAISAPFSGVLGFRKVSLGALVTPGTAITTLDDINTIKVDFTIPEKYVGKVTTGHHIEAQTRAYPKRLFKGKITTIATRIDPVTRALTVRARINNPEHLLRPGMLLTIDIILGQHESIMIPESALVSINDKHFVFIVLPDHKVLQQQVSLGLRRQGRIEITKGLKPGQQIVVDGGFRLQPGRSVVINQPAKT